MKIKVCKMCGVEFESLTSRSVYCITCRRVRASLIKRKSKARQMGLELGDEQPYLPPGKSRTYTLVYDPIDYIDGGFTPGVTMTKYEVAACLTNKSFMVKTKVKSNGKVYEVREYNESLYLAPV